jgi:hypothetical protein
MVLPLLLVADNVAVVTRCIVPAVEAIPTWFDIHQNLQVVMSR